MIGAESLPIHMMSGPDLIARADAGRASGLAPRRRVPAQHPYNGNSHAADHCMFVPVIDDDGVHRFTVLAKAHQADCGNSQPTTYMADARDVYEEGALIFDACPGPGRDYEDNEDVLRMLQTEDPGARTSGGATTWRCSARCGWASAAWWSSATDSGWDTLERSSCDWFDYSEQLMSEAIARLPAARFSVEQRATTLTPGFRTVSRRLVDDRRGPERRAHRAST